VVEKMQRLKINPGDTIQVHDIVANYERGLSVDVLGVGNEFNDMKKKLVIHEPTRIEAKKDFYTCGSVFLEFEGKDLDKPQPLVVRESKNRASLQYKLKINGKIRIVENFSRVTLQQGDKLIIEDLISGDIDPSDYVVNFKGFVGNSSNNTGEDRGYVIDTGAGVLMDRYSLEKSGRHYYVVTTMGDKEVGRIYIDIQS